MASQYPVGFTPDAPAATAYPEGFTPAASPPTTPPAGLPGPTEMLQGLRGSVGKMLGKTPLQHAPEWYQELVNPVPGSLMEAGGLLGGGVAAKATRGWGPLNRILGGALGAEGGNLAAGGTPGQGALVGGVGSTAGEVIGALPRPLGWLARSVSNNPVIGGKRNIADAYQTRLGRTIGEIVPEMGTPRTGEDFAALARLARGTRLPGGMSQQRGYEEALGEMLDVAAANINQMVGPRQLNLTALPPGSLPAVQGATLLSAQGQPLENVVAASRGAAMPFDQALATLRELYARAYQSGGPIRSQAVAAMDPTAAKMLAESLKQEITAELQRLSPQARQLFQTSQNKFAMGTEIAQDIDRALRLSPNRTELAEQALQQTVFDRLGDVSAKLGRQRVTEATPNDALTRYLGAVYNQGGLGKTIPSTGTGSFGDSFRRAYGQGQGGTPAGVAAIPKAVLENAGAVYTGQQPYARSFTLPPMLQQALDVVLQQQAARAGQ